MKLRTLLSIGLLGLTPSLVLAQDEAVPHVPVVAKAPTAARPAMAIPVWMVPATGQVPSTLRTATVAMVAPQAVDMPLGLMEVPPAPAASLGPAAAQPPTPPAAPKAPTAVTPAAAPAVAPAAPAPPRPIGQMVNVQIEVTLSDSKGPSKTVMLTVADGEMGQNRTGAYISGTASGGTNFGFNADGRPTVSGNKIRLYLSAEATLPPTGGGAESKMTPALSLRQSQTIVLNDGATVEIARATDPVSDRSFVLTVKATIQR